MTCFPEHRVAHCLGVFGRLAELGRRCSRSCSRGRGMRERRGFRRLRFPEMERPRKEDLGDNGVPFSFVESFDFGFLEKGCTRCENSSGFLLGDVIWCVCFFLSLSLSLFFFLKKTLLIKTNKFKVLIVLLACIVRREDYDSDYTTTAPS